MSVGIYLGIHSQLSYCSCHQQRDIVSGRRVYCIHIHNPYKGRVVRRWYSRKNNLLEGNRHTVHGLEPLGTVAPGEKQNDERRRSVAAMGQTVDGIGC